MVRLRRGLWQHDPTTHSDALVQHLVVEALVRQRAGVGLATVCQSLYGAARLALSTSLSHVVHERLYA